MMMIRHWNRAIPVVAACLASALMISLSSCRSSRGSSGLPRNLPNIQLSGPTETPPHAMASHDYPFDSGGRYVTDWAADGERRAGRSAAATSADSSRWTSSHGGSASKRKVAATSKSKSKSKSSGSPKVTTTSKAKAKPKSSSGGGRSYTVAKGDTLSRIAAKYGTSVSKIKSANGMSSDFLSIGRKLRIP